MTPADPYMIAIQEPNVEVHFRAVTQLTEKGIIDADGVHSEIDTVICATGWYCLLPGLLLETDCFSQRLRYYLPTSISYFW